MNINIQHQPIHSFIVFRYVFIVQQFAPMAPAVHFDEVFVQGFVICTNTHYVISFIISLTFASPLVCVGGLEEMATASNKWPVISRIYCWLRRNDKKLRFYHLSLIGLRGLRGACEACYRGRSRPMYILASY